MAIETDFNDLDYPSFSVVFLFWEKAEEEFNSDIVIEQKDGCEKAYR